MYYKYGIRALSAQGSVSASRSVRSGRFYCNKLLSCHEDCNVLMNTASDQQNYGSKYMYRIEGPGNKANCKPQYDSVLVAWTGCLNDANDVAWLGIFSTGCYSGMKTWPTPPQCCFSLRISRPLSS